MKLLFIEAGTRYKKDKDDNWYTDGNFNERIWHRYQSYCDNLTVFARCEEKIYEKEYAESHFNKFPSNIKLVTFKDLYKPKKNFFDFNLRKKIKSSLKEEIRKNDFIIIRSITNYYTLTAAKICKQLKKKYLIEVTGVAFDALWNHGDLFGKIYAIPIEMKKKFYLRKSPYAVYVTEKTLQKRYPCKGQILGCSDVEIKPIDQIVIENRKEKIENLKEKDKIILGTLAWVNVKTKGQKDVIKALSVLKKVGQTNFEYQLVGGGDREYLQNIARKLDVEEQVKFVGQKPHKEVFNWLDEIDVYIQPSYQEGLCRAVIEAMSRGCPIICSDAGGNIELATKNNVFKRKNIHQIVKILQRVDKENIKEESERSFKEAKKYEKSLLDDKRDNFYKRVIHN